MNLEAGAPRIGFNLNLTSKNFIILMMCLVFTYFFVHDGFFGYPKKNEYIIQQVIKPAVNAPASALPFDEILENWQGWDNESAERHQAMDRYVDTLKTKVATNGWKTTTDINVQRWICAALVLFSIGALWRFISHLRLKVRATDTAVSPRPGLSIPWEKITQVDNTEWRSYGIVKITYTDASGNPATAEFDDYKTQREPLLKILDALGEKAVNAEFIPKEQAADAGATAP